jgi:hypothetical protein
MRLATTFPLGHLVATRNALEVIPRPEIESAIKRHAIRDWGELGEEDRSANDQALVDGTRILFSYRTLAGIHFWIITEADRSATTVLLPSDY